MDQMKKYRFGSVRETAPTVRLGRSYTTNPHRRNYWPAGFGGNNNNPTVWQMLWRKIRFRRDNNTKKKKLSSSCAAMEGIYDIDTYSKNFDQGLSWMEPDNLCRSFSSRFADPSRIFPPRHLLDWRPERGFKVLCIWIFQFFIINSICMIFSPQN